MKFRPFAEAREYVHTLGLNRMNAWKEYCKSGKKPRDIPSHPDYVYKNEGWKGMKNSLGTENKKPVSRHDKYRPFVYAREFIRKLGIKSQSEWHNSYCKSGKKPQDIPSNPQQVYKNEGWKGWGIGLEQIQLHHKIKSFYHLKKLRNLFIN